MNWYSEHAPTNVAGFRLKFTNGWTASVFSRPNLNTIEVNAWNDKGDEEHPGPINPDNLPEFLTKIKAKKG